MQTTQTNTVLIPLDFSDIAMNALDHAITVAKHFNNNLALLYVIEEAFLGGLLGRNEKQIEMLKEAANIRLVKLVEEIKTTHNIDCTIVIRTGKIYNVIASVVEELKCDSVIMGSHGASGLGQILGSNSSRTIIHSKVPVIVVKSAQKTNLYKNIVFPIDLSLESRQKVKWAIHLGKSYGSVIRLFSFKANDEIADAKIEGALHQVKNILDENNIEYTTHIVSKLDGNFAEETVKYAESIDADMLMIMTRTEDKDFSEMVFGTYAQQIVNTSRTIPVMCINPNKTGMVSGNARY
ncbi:MAG: universal stress protein [Bacteroidia bacterium]|nr:universal stress protein [Bacteroidia bacterium]MBP9688725.1 universal stress protein [Bacteroidia bacterium]